ncbi:MAG TPA: 30S ribosomal protein S18, partial [Anaerolineales bacterium]|nr:30S ribosomal protein S18 [Anaerolineales bacterium]
MAFYRGSNRNRSYNRRPSVCQFCADKVTQLDYKNLDIVARQIDPEGKIRPRRRTGTCARHQRMVAIAVKRARHMALL